MASDNVNHPAREMSGRHPERTRQNLGSGREVLTDASERKPAELACIHHIAQCS